MIEIRWHPSRKELRGFALLFLLFFGGLSAYLRFGPPRWEVFPLFLGGLAVLVGGTGIFAPALVRPVYLGMIVGTFPIGWTVSHLVLVVLYYGILTPIGLIRRCFGDPVRKKADPEKTSYWEPGSGVRDERRYFRQF